MFFLFLVVRPGCYRFGHPADVAAATGVLPNLERVVSRVSALANITMRLLLTRPIFHLLARGPVGGQALPAPHSTAQFCGSDQTPAPQARRHRNRTDRCSRDMKSRIVARLCIALSSLMRRRSYGLRLRQFFEPWD